MFSQISKETKQYIRPISICAIVLWGLYLRFQCYASRELFTDELRSIRFLYGPLKPFWQRCQYADMTAFPGDYLITYPFFRIFGPDKWGLAIPYIISTLIGLYLLYRICQRYCKTTLGYIIAFAVVCFHRELIFYSIELRPYPILPTLALASFYFSEIIVKRPKQLTKLHKYFIGIFFILAMWFHAFVIMIAGLCFLFHFMCQLKDKSFKNIFRENFKFVGSIFLIALPVWLWYATVKGDPHDVWYGRFFYAFDFIPHPIYEPVGFLKAIFGNLIGNRIFYFLLKK